MSKNQSHLNDDYLEVIFDINPNITIMINGTNIEKVNQEMLNFTGYTDLDAFKKEHDGICDFFLEGNKDCIGSVIEGENWLKYISIRPRQTYIVCMQKNALNSYFNIIVKQLDIENEKKYLVVLNDITEQYKLEKKLQESKDMFDLFMNNMPYVVVIKDDNHIIKYENPIAQKYSHGFHIGHSAEENLGHSLGIKVDALTTKAQKEGHAEAIFEFENENGKYIFRALSFAIPQEDGTTDVGMIYIDITEQKRMADEIEKQKELMIFQSRHAAMGEMISMIAHQWRQPISVIAMDANNILVDMELDNIKTQSLKEDVSDIVKQTKHLSQTIDDFRNFFKPNKLKDKVLVSDIFDETIRVIDKSFLNNNIVLKNDFETYTIIEIFSRELLQVLLNILKNAKEELMQRKENNRIITNKIYEDKDNIIIEISDNAGGIEEDIINKIFNPYFSTKDEKNGTGLGLYMSKVIIEKHLFGTIKASNTQEGALFRIILPKIEKGTQRV